MAHPSSRRARSLLCFCSFSVRASFVVDFDWCWCFGFDLLLVKNAFSSQISLSNIARDRRKKQKKTNSDKIPGIRLGHCVPGGRRLLPVGGHLCIKVAPQSRGGRWRVDLVVVSRRTWWRRPVGRPSTGSVIIHQSPNRNFWWHRGIRRSAHGRAPVKEMEVP